ncbi:MAG: hypothetical protein B7Z60_02985 [Ferrovum sp. 37-45-19]|jgi:hypothetical protein|uniref:BPSS1780 family membrane protein n=1 Tax=Ferrovum sp. JA12 TaxID=1356299 RepID=UPI00070365A1|nr:BPSS1780 family membrane protein [Ferrovum sp. JA12]OYV80466.1 MAG: hypothetical protein B7Z65_01055 [Ferrovum sp. 21-44-67]OYV94781.1 MAG: hypothetical protein B7Z60_02985 [Ferrovum sp. 37-45-19]HQT81099.1 BPSS1780 family membrane protein [Ferrovaceae bacterium]KRH79175.1 hypothetical protein FERRO_02380 [Ferrovum sp. JA12]HQU06084.1 BPSS1780 family membrane protein [Ferrovaceae bacterium]
MSTLTNPVAVPPLRGIHWISEGFTLVFHSPVGWLSVMSIWFFFALLCSIFWGFGPVLFSLTLPIFFAGLMVGCRHISAGRSLKVHHLFTGFTVKNPRLVGLGGVNVFWEVVLSVITLLWGGQHMTSFQNMIFDNTTNAEELQVIISELTPMFITLSLVQLVLLVLGWYAPALLIFSPVSLLEAITVSGKACVINILPIIVYLITMAAILAAIGFTVLTVPLLGFLLSLFVIPTIVASVYVSYSDVFKQESPSTP